MVEVHPEGIGVIINGSGSTGDQRLGDMSRIGMSMLASKGNISDVQKVDIDLSFIMLEKTRNCRGSRYYDPVIEDCSRSCGRYNVNLRVKCLKFDNGGEYSSLLIKFCVENGIVVLKIVPEIPLQFGVAERLSRTFRAESTEIRGEAPKIGGIARERYQSRTLGGSGSDEVRYSFQDMKSHQVIRSRYITFADSIYRARSATDSSSLTKPIQKSQVVLVDIPENLVENDSIAAEHGLSSEITQSPGGSSDTSEGSENSGTFKDSGRSDEEYFEDRASFEEGGSRLHSFKDPSGSPGLRKEFVQWKKAIIEEMVSLDKNQTCSLVRLPAGKKASQSLLRDYHISLV
ncbi:retrovirus-related pol polyprotein from transposon TNT 1-94 [Tanacetum coccineum]